MNKGRLILVPCTLGPDGNINSLSKEIFDFIEKIDFYLAENIRTARRFLSSAGINKKIETITFEVYNKDTSIIDIKNAIEHINNGNDVGLISEAGCPAIADPGAQIVAYCHTQNIEIIPLVGPSSILLSLMASGFNGQNFTFHGYLPKERNERIKYLRKIEDNIYNKSETQIFIETPFRNNHILEDALKTLRNSTLLCIASDITIPSQKIITKSIDNWKKIKIDLNKKPTIFLLYKSV